MRSEDAVSLIVFTGAQQSYDMGQTRFTVQVYVDDLAQRSSYAFQLAMEFCRLLSARQCAFRIAR